MLLMLRTNPISWMFTSCQTVVYHITIATDLFSQNRVFVSWCLPSSLYLSCCGSFSTMWKTHLVRNTPLPKKLGRNRLGRSRSIVVFRQNPRFIYFDCLPRCFFLGRRGGKPNWRHRTIWKSVWPYRTWLHWLTWNIFIFVLIVILFGKLMN